MTEVFNFRELKDAIDDSRYEYKMVFMTVPHCMKCKNVKKKFLKWPQAHGYENVKYIVFCAENVSEGRDWVVNAGPKELEYVNFPYWLYWKGGLKGKALYNMSSGITSLAEERLADFVVVKKDTPTRKHYGASHSYTA
ncbi:unnamed protein product [Oikopleura dioica]|uniref:Thioredoxin domain-containing protein n=1 Tax=Oikopleura dioica TaxID=34765 RepID=E4WW80_OIKDI|nr:unnamed protein product [Oikopleura dioica]CBY33671.1 unnamed protein product [Oikopleura dioica]